MVLTLRTPTHVLPFCTSLYCENASLLMRNDYGFDCISITITSGKRRANIGLRYSLFQQHSSGKFITKSEARKKDSGKTQWVFALSIIRIIVRERRFLL